MIFYSTTRTNESTIESTIESTNESIMSYSAYLSENLYVGVESGVKCENQNPCNFCLDVEKRTNYCSCCSIPTSTKYIVVDGEIISNNNLHTCEECGFTAHWTCHAGKSMMLPSDVMELDRIRCTQCKSMIGHLENEVKYVKNTESKHTAEDRVVIYTLRDALGECSRMRRGYFKTNRTKKLFDYVIENGQAYRRFATDSLYTVVKEKIKEFSSVWGEAQSRFYLDNIF